MRQFATKFLPRFLPRKWASRNRRPAAGVNHAGPTVASAYLQSTERVGFGTGFGVKLFGLWLFASGLLATIANSKRFKLLRNSLGRVQPRKVTSITLTEPERT
jgi:hypothetical protein